MAATRWDNICTSSMPDRIELGYDVSIMPEGVGRR